MSLPINHTFQGSLSSTVLQQREKHGNNKELCEDSSHGDLYYSCRGGRANYCHQKEEEASKVRQPNVLYIHTSIWIVCQIPFKVHSVCRSNSSKFIQQFLSHFCTSGNPRVLCESSASKVKVAGRSYETLRVVGCAQRLVTNILTYKNSTPYTYSIFTQGGIQSPKNLNTDVKSRGPYHKKAYNQTYM